MSRTNAEIRELIRETREEAQKLDAEEMRRHQIEAGTYNYALHIPKELGEPITIARRSVTEIATVIQSIISWPLRPLVNLSAKGPTAEGDADKLEAFFAHNLLRLDPTGAIGRRARSHMVRSRFGALWLRVNPDEAMTQKPGESDKVYEQRKARHESAYWRWAMDALNPRTLGFLKRDDRVTLACIEEEIPYLSLLQYVDGKDAEGKDPIDAIRGKFGNLRAGDGSSPEDNTQAQYKKLTRYIVDDGANICHYVQRASSREEYEQVQEVKNTFGRSSLLILPGIERPHSPIEERYEGLMAVACELEFQLSMCDSLLMTIAANPRYAEELPPEVAVELSRLVAGGTDPKLISQTRLEQRDSEGNRVVPAVRGNLKDITSSDLVQAISAQRESLERQWERLRQDLMAVNPDANSAEQMPAASLLALMEAGMRRFEEPQAVIVSAYTEIGLMVAHDVANGLNPHLSKSGEDKALDRGITFTAVGAEQTRKKIDGGSEYKLGPALFARFPDDATLKMEPITTSEAKQTALVQMELGLLEKGMSNPGKVYEARGISDTSKALSEDSAWNNAQLLSPGMAKLAMADAIRFIAMRDERDEQLLVDLWMPQPEAAPPGNEPTSKGYQYNAPAAPGPPGGMTA